MMRGTIIPTHPIETMHLSAIAAVVMDPGSAAGYEALYREAEAGGDMQVASTAYALMLICAGGLRRETVPQFTKNWFVAESRYYQFYFSAFFGARLVTPDHWLERRVARGGHLSRAKRQALLAALTRTAPISVDQPGVLLCGMPKSASTFFSGCLADCLGRKATTPHNINDGTGTNFDLMRFLQTNQPGAVLHSHLLASPRTLTMLKIFGIRPVITVRNVFDAIRSYADHLARPWQTANPNADEPDWNTVATLRMADFYVEFYATWQRAIADGYEVHVETFDAIRNEPAEAAARTLGFLGAAVEESAIHAAVARLSRPEHRVAMRFNVGAPGRGAEIAEHLREHVRSLYALYPDVDFSAIDPGAQQRQRIAS